MKRRLLLPTIGVLLILLVLATCSEGNRSLSKRRSRPVLVILREIERGGDRELLRSSEPRDLIRTLEEARCEVVVASRSGRLFTSGSHEPSIEAVKLCEIDDVSSFAAIVIPSEKWSYLVMKGEPISDDILALVHQAHEARLLIAAQRWGISVLAQAGVLESKRYACGRPSVPMMSIGTAIPDSEHEVVRDGNLITCSQEVDPGWALGHAVLEALGSN